MDKATAQQILTQHKENEKTNSHTENCLLLAEAFEDDHAESVSRTALGIVKHRGYASDHSKEAHQLTRSYYYKLVKIANS